MSVESVAPATSGAAWRDAEECEHLAQIYEDDAALLDAVRAYALQGLTDGGAVVVIATRAHLAELERHWREDAIDLDRLAAERRLQLFGAERTLELLLDGAGMPRRDAFFEHIGAIFADAVARAPRVRAFGEMVGLLWRDGNPDAALRLEDFWSELAATHRFSLLCGYNLQDCARREHSAAFDAMCARHQRVIPAESTRLYSDDPLRVIARLQQRAAALEQEVQIGHEAEQRLAQLAAIVADSDDAIVSKTLDGVIRSWNAGAERIFGWSAAEAVGQPITLIIPPELLDEEREILRKIRGGERIDHFETVRVAKDGRRLQISLTVSPVRNTRGEIIGASKIARDVSERRRAEQALIESRLQVLLEAKALAKLNEWSSRLWRCRDLEAGFEQMLEGVIELLGADKGAVQLLENGALVFAAQRGFDTELIERFKHVCADHGTACGRALRTGERVIVEDTETDAPFAPYRELARNADFRAVVSTPLFTADGDLFGVISTHFRAPHRPNERELRRKDLYARQSGDFIQRCRIEEALRASADRRAFVLKLNDELRVLSDPQAIQELAARMLGERLGVCRAHYIEFEGEELVVRCEYADGVRSMIGRHRVPDYGGELITKIGLGKLAVIEDVQAHPRLSECEKRNFAAFGSAALAGVILSKDGAPTAAFGVHSAAPRRWSEAELDLIADVGERVWVAAERASAVAALRESERELSVADQRKDEFLATLAHELRNPLAPIRNALYLLRLNGANANPERLHEILDRQVTHVVRLVDDLLEVSRITRGKIELRRESVPLAQALRIAVETSRPAIDRGAHRLTLSLPDEPLPVYGDLVRLSQVFANLLNNAAKYTDPGGSIELSMRREGAQAVIDVSDNGIGIAPEQLTRLFEMFSQVERSTQRSQGGLGIGLWLVKRLVELHGGSVEVVSEGLGRGSRFSVRLPLEQMSLLQKHFVPEGMPPRRRVLIMDANKDAADSLGMLLSELGAEVCVLYGGASATELLASWRPDVVLLDLSMPGCDGFALARRLRALLPNDTVFVALGAHALEEDRQRSLAAGFQHHLAKPVDFGALQALLLAFDVEHALAARTA